MNGVKNFLLFLNDNWTTILVCVGIIVGLVIRAINFFTKSTDEQVEIAKEQIKNVMLKLVSSAELDWQSWTKAGSIKRSQVISKIYEDYPILENVVDQTSLIEWIDEQIDSSLVTLREVISTQKTE